MDPVQVAVPGCEAAEIVLAKDQPEYIQLPALPFEVDGARGLLTRWRPTPAEREAIARGADIYLTVMTFGKPLQPVRLTVDCPIEPDASKVS